MKIRGRPPYSIIKFRFGGFRDEEVLKQDAEVLGQDAEILRQDAEV